MRSKSTVTLSDVTGAMPMELYVAPRTNVFHYDDSELRASWVDVYAERLMNGQDLWSGEPLEAAREEARRILDQQSKPQFGCRRPRNHNCISGGA